MSYLSKSSPGCQVSMRRVMSNARKLIDIGANLTDDMYKGVYHGSKKHEPDLELVLDRSWKAKLDKIIITGGNLAESKTALELAQTNDRLYSTVGCHPTRCGEFEPDPSQYLEDLAKIIESGKEKVVAIGECGLDYDRLNFCDKETQKKYFEYQLQLCERFKLPLFLHCRAASDDFFDILSRNPNIEGVMHSFDGSIDDLNRAVKMGLYIGINGCSLKTEENLTVAKEIPENRLLIETDCPWCEIRPTHASAKHVSTQYPSTKKEKHNGSMVKGRNEPANLIQVLEVLADIRNDNLDVLCDKIYENSLKLFFNNR